MVVLLGIITMGAPQASARPDPDESVGEVYDPATDLRLLEEPDVGQNINGGIEPVGFNPFAGYPAAPTPAASSETLWAGTMTVGETVAPFRTASVYCIDLGTSTRAGINYDVGDWTEANVPNLGWVHYILTRYHPFIPGEPAAAPTDTARAAAVQAAIWFFTDRFVLTAASGIRAYTQAIVADALLNGPTGEHPSPELTLTPTTIAAPSTGDIVGPITVGGNVEGAVTAIEELEVFRDAAGTQPVAVGDPVGPGDQLWLRSTPSGAEPPPDPVLQISAQVLTKLGHVLVYDGTNPGVTEAQKLVLALERPLSVNAAVVADIFQAGQLQVNKTIGGTGAGFQGIVTLAVDCDSEDDAFDRTFTVDASTPAGTTALPLISGIPIDTTCTVTETADGDNGLVNITTPVTIEPAETVIAEGPPAEVAVTNTYDRAYGGLTIVKSIQGPAAGLQGPVTLHLDCDDPENAFDSDFTIPGWVSSGDYQQTVDNIPAGTTCAVTETADGGNDDAVLRDQVTIEPSTVVIADAVTASITATNRYENAVLLAATGVPLGLGTAAIAASGFLLAGVGLLVFSRRLTRRRR
ncbi:MAG: DUF5979 domain-containing protein [Actinophytocola sp.]|uniref:DUF5979 domain-containing protein n=1 Tax=Actinophytocola sp. TaxID=1872138 RepID=UPI003C717B93